MAKTAGQSIENQLIAARARHLVGHVEGSLIDALIRLQQLREAIQSIGDSTDSEFFRYFPVAAIAVLETHFKLTVQSIVDAGSPYLERGLMLTRDKMRSISDFFPSLHRKTVSVGELVAHQLPFNSISSIEEALGELLGGKLKPMLSSICDPFYTRREVECSPMVEDADLLWREIAETFEQRHILAHEAATNYVVTAAEANRAVESVATFVMATDALLWETVWKTKPLTGPEMRDDAAERYGQARIRLAQALRLANRIGRKHEQIYMSKFRLLHREWRQYASQWARLESNDHAMGATRMLVLLTSLERLYSARADDVTAWCNSFEPVSDL